jgi:signal transduction histidine kinase
MRLDCTPLEIAAVAADLGEELAPLARRRQHTLDVVVQAAGIVVADESRVLQVGRALVDNALLHTPPGTHVRIVARGAALAVEDDGPGIPVDYQERVFARFSRLDGSRASGTGLGLAIARELVEAQGGELTLAGANAFTIALSAQDPGVPDRVAPGLGPDAHAVRSAPDADAP